MYAIIRRFGEDFGIHIVLSRGLTIMTINLNENVRILKKSFWLCIYCNIILSKEIDHHKSKHFLIFVDAYGLR